jgi:hypothetical protein
MTLRYVNRSSATLQHFKLPIQEITVAHGENGRDWRFLLSRVMIDSKSVAFWSV